MFSSYPLYIIALGMLTSFHVLYRPERGGANKWQSEQQLREKGKGSPLSVNERGSQESKARRNSGTDSGGVFARAGGGSGPQGKVRDMGEGGREGKHEQYILPWRQIVQNIFYGTSGTCFL